MDLLLQIGLFAVLLAIGLFIGGAVERRHFRALAAKEAMLRDVLVFNERRPPAERAFATLGGHIVVTRALYELMPTENALAMVLAHEIAHLAARDPIAAIGGARCSHSRSRSSAAKRAVC